jgi:2-hydroxy-3-keto-5-methylthiopentenyl-1-phosphate phosphatase
MFAEMSSLIIDSMSETNRDWYIGTDVSDQPATAICRRLFSRHSLENYNRLSLIPHKALRCVEAKTLAD